MTWDSFLAASVGERARDLLEDFEVIATKLFMVLVPRDPSSQTLKDNLHAAIAASTLGLSSIDYAKRMYCRSDQRNEDDSEAVEPVHAYIAAYRSAKAYIQRMCKKVEPDGLPNPELGVFGSSLVLERLPPSFFSAHLLYRLGHRYEGHAVSRLILEQIAWAYAAHSLRDIHEIERIETTRAVSQLKRFIPEAGKLYGFLSTKTHIDYGSHAEFLAIEKDRNIILHAQPEFVEYAEVILQLADLFGLVWELSQGNYVKTPETIEVGPTGPLIRQDRPFLETINSHLSEIKSALSHTGVMKPRSAKQANPPPKGTRRKRRAP
jgi:hypothetical protein